MAQRPLAGKHELDRTQQDAYAMVCIGRTQGDGMENVATEKVENKLTKSPLGDSLIYHPTNLRQTGSIPPVTPTGTIVNLVPKHARNTKEEKQASNTLKFKDPKFVPYEPYKAAVNPIVPLDKKTKKCRKNDVSINVPVCQVAAMKIQEANPIYKEKSKNNDPNALEQKWEKESKVYESQIQKLKEENCRLEHQLKFQAQVNGELKNLLVAAVGEDLETRVHILTEDKLQLARALLNSAQHLSTHQEQTEWLAGQCEVWRSKFLASSLMVEELAKWKAILLQRTMDLHDGMKKLLNEHDSIRDFCLKAYRALSILREKFDPVGAMSSRNEQRLPGANVLDLARNCSQLSEILKIQLLSGLESLSPQSDASLGDICSKTPAETLADRLLTSPKLLMSMRQDVACSAVMGAAVAVGEQMLLPGKESKIACCPHCSGEIKQL